LKNKIISLFVSIVFCVGMFDFAHVYAATGVTYYVSTAGNDITGTGSLSKPFKTISCAAKKMVAGDTCVIRGGTYKETVNVSESGTSQSPVTFKCYPGETVLVDGTNVLSGWSLYRDNIYVTESMNISLGIENDLIFMGNSLVNFAKWPSDDSTSNWVNHTCSVLEEGSNATTLVDSALNFPDDYWNGASVQIASGSAWYLFNLTVNDSTNGSLTTATNSLSGESYDPKNGNKYFIYNSLNALDSENEWYYNNTSGKLYVWLPNGENPSNCQVSARQRLNGFVLDDKEYVNISGIDFVGCGVSMNNTDSSTLNDISVKYTSNALNITGDNNIVKNSTFQYSTKKLINVVGNNNYIFNNLMEYAASMVNTQLFLLEGESNVVRYNTMRYATRDVLGFSQAHSCIIEHNDISHAGTMTIDNGCMYAGFSEGVNTEIRYNYLHDNDAKAIGDGFYIDNGSSNYIFHHNLVWNVDSAVRTNCPSNNNLIYNNTLIGSVLTAASQTTDFSGNRFVNNIVTGNYKLDFVYYQTWTNQSGGYTLSYNNILSDTAPMLNSDYTLSSASSAIDRGVLIDNINSNFVGNAPDIGAFEYGETAWTAGCDLSNMPDESYGGLSDVKYSNKVKFGAFEYNLNQTPWIKTGAQSSDLVYGWSTTVANTARRGGVYGLRLGLDENNTGEYDGIYQIVDSLKANTNYNFIAWKRVTNSSDTITMGIEGVTANTYENPYATTSWVKYTIPFTTTNDVSNVRIYFNKEITSTGVGYVDDVSIVERDAGPIGVPENIIDSAKTNTGIDNVFVVDGKSFILLNSNGIGNNKYFVVSKDFYGAQSIDSVISQRFKPGDENNIGYYLNNSLSLPNSIKTHINNQQEWFAEAGNYKGDAPEDYTIKCGINLLSYREYIDYADKIGTVDSASSTYSGWWLRNGEGVDFERGYMLYVSTKNTGRIYKGLYSAQMLVRPAFYLNENFFKNVALASMGSNVIKTIKENYNLADVYNVYSDKYTYEQFLNMLNPGCNTFMLDEENQETGKATSFILSGTETDQSGNLWVNVISTKIFGDGWRAAALVDDPDIADTKYKLITYSGNSLDQFKTTQFPACITNSMVKKDWTILTDSKYMNSYICFPSADEFINNTDALNLIKNNLTSQYVLTRTDNTYGGAYGITYAGAKYMNCPWGSSQYYFIFESCLNANFFKTVKLDVSTMGSNVKALLKANFYRAELAVIYTDTELTSIGFGDSDFSNGATFTLAASQQETGKASSFIFSGTDTGSANVISTKIYGDGWRSAGFIDDPDIADAKYKLITYSGNSLDQFKTTQFPACITNSMIKKDWEIAAGTKYMQSYVCFPSKAEILNNQEVINVIVNKAIADSHYILTRTDNTYGGFWAITNKGGGYMAGTYGASQYYFLFECALNNNFFKTVKLDIKGMGIDVRDYIRANFTAEDLQSIYNETELYTLFGNELSKEVIVDATVAYKANGTVIATKTGADEISASVVVENDTSNDITGINVIMAVYNGDGKLSAYKMVSCDDLNSGVSSDIIPLNLTNIDNITSNFRVSFMVWKDNIEPLCNRIDK